MKRIVALLMVMALLADTAAADLRFTILDFGLARPAPTVQCKIQNPQSEIFVRQALAPDGKEFLHSYWKNWRQRVGESRLFRAVFQRDRTFNLLAQERLLFGRARAGSHPLGGKKPRDRSNKNKKGYPIEEQALQLIDSGHYQKAADLLQKVQDSSGYPIVLRASRSPEISRRVRKSLNDGDMDRAIQWLLRASPTDRLQVELKNLAVALEAHRNDTSMSPALAVALGEFIDYYKAAPMGTNGLWEKRIGDHLMKYLSRQWPPEVTRFLEKYSFGPVLATRRFAAVSVIVELLRAGYGMPAVEYLSKVSGEDGPRAMIVLQGFPDSDQLSLLHQAARDHPESDFLILPTNEPLAATTGIGWRLQKAHYGLMFQEGKPVFVIFSDWPVVHYLACDAHALSQEAAKSHLATGGDRSRWEYLSQRQVAASIFDQKNIRSPRWMAFDVTDSSSERITIRRKNSKPWRVLVRNHSSLDQQVDQYLRDFFAENDILEVVIAPVLDNGGDSVLYVTPDNLSEFLPEIAALLHQGTSLIVQERIVPPLVPEGNVRMDSRIRGYLSADPKGHARLMVQYGPDRTAINHAQGAQTAIFEEWIKKWGLSPSESAALKKEIVALARDAALAIGAGMKEDKLKMQSDYPADWMAVDIMVRRENQRWVPYVINIHGDDAGGAGEWDALMRKRQPELGNEARRIGEMTLDYSAWMTQRAARHLEPLEPAVPRGANYHSLGAYVTLAAYLAHGLITHDFSTKIFLELYAACVVVHELIGHGIFARWTKNNWLSYVVKALGLIGPPAEYPTVLKILFAPLLTLFTGLIFFADPALAPLSPWLIIGSLFDLIPWIPWTDGRAALQHERTRMPGDILAENANAIGNLRFTTQLFDWLFRLFLQWPFRFLEVIRGHLLIQRITRHTLGGPVRLEYGTRVSVIEAHPFLLGRALDAVAARISVEPQNQVIVMPIDHVLAPRFWRRYGRWLQFNEKGAPGAGWFTDRIPRDGHAAFIMTGNSADAHQAAYGALLDHIIPAYRSGSSAKMDIIFPIALNVGGLPPALQRDDLPAYGDRLAEAGIPYTVYVDRTMIGRSPAQEAPAVRIFFVSDIPQLMPISRPQPNEKAAPARLYELMSAPSLVNYHVFLSVEQIRLRCPELPADTVSNALSVLRELGLIEREGWFGHARYRIVDLSSEQRQMAASILRKFRDSTSNQPLQTWKKEWEDYLLQCFGSLFKNVHIHTRRGSFWTFRPFIRWIPSEHRLDVTFPSHPYTYLELLDALPKDFLLVAQFDPGTLPPGNESTASEPAPSAPEPVVSATAPQPAPESPPPPNTILVPIEIQHLLWEGNVGRMDPLRQWSGTVNVDKTGPTLGSVLAAARSLPGQDLPSGDVACLIGGSIVTKENTTMDADTVRTITIIRLHKPAIHWIYISADVLRDDLNQPDAREGEWRAVSGKGLTGEMIINAVGLRPAWSMNWLEISLGDNRLANFGKVVPVGSVLSVKGVLENKHPKPRGSGKGRELYSLGTFFAAYLAKGFLTHDFSVGILFWLALTLEIVMVLAIPRNQVDNDLLTAPGLGLDEDTVASFRMMTYMADRFGKVGASELWAMHSQIRPEEFQRRMKELEHKGLGDYYKKDRQPWFQLSPAARRLQTALHLNADDPWLLDQWQAIKDQCGLSEADFVNACCRLVPLAESERTPALPQPKRYLIVHFIDGKFKNNAQLFNRMYQMAQDPEIVDRLRQAARRRIAPPQKNGHAGVWEVPPYLLSEFLQKPSVHTLAQLMPFLRQSLQKDFLEQARAVYDPETGAFRAGVVATRLRGQELDFRVMKSNHDVRPGDRIQLVRPDSTASADESTPPAPVQRSPFRSLLKGIAILCIAAGLSLTVKAQPPPDSGAHISISIQRHKTKPAAATNKPKIHHVLVKWVGPLLRNRSMPGHFEFNLVGKVTPRRILDYIQQVVKTQLPPAELISADGTDNNKDLNKNPDQEFEPFYPLELIPKEKEIKDPESEKDLDPGPLRTIVDESITGRAARADYILFKAPWRETVRYVWRNVGVSAAAGALAAGMILFALPWHPSMTAVRMILVSSFFVTGLIANIFSARAFHDAHKKIYRIAKDDILVDKPNERERQILFQSGFFYGMWLPILGSIGDGAMLFGNSATLLPALMFWALAFIGPWMLHRDENQILYSKYKDQSFFHAIAEDPLAAPAARKTNFMESWSPTALPGASITFDDPLEEWASPELIQKLEAMGLRRAAMRETSLALRDAYTPRLDRKRTQRLDELTDELSDSVVTMISEHRLIVGLGAKEALGLKEYLVKMKWDVVVEEPALLTEKSEAIFALYRDGNTIHMARQDTVLEREPRTDILYYLRHFSREIFERMQWPDSQEVRRMVLSAFNAVAIHAARTGLSELEIIDRLSAYTVEPEVRYYGEHAEMFPWLSQTDSARRRASWMVPISFFYMPGDIALDYIALSELIGHLLNPDAPDLDDDLQGVEPAVWPDLIYRYGLQGIINGFQDARKSSPFLDVAITVCERALRENRPLRETLLHTLHPERLEDLRRAQAALFDPANPSSYYKELWTAARALQDKMVTTVYTPYGRIARKLSPMKARPAAPIDPLAALGLDAKTASTFRMLAFAWDQKKGKVTGADFKKMHIGVRTEEVARRMAILKAKDLATVQNNTFLPIVFFSRSALALREKLDLIPDHPSLVAKWKEIKRDSGLSEDAFIQGCCRLTGIHFSNHFMAEQVTSAFLDGKSRGHIQLFDRLYVLAQDPTIIQRLKDIAPKSKLGKAQENQGKAWEIPRDALHGFYRSHKSATVQHLLEYLPGYLATFPSMKAMCVFSQTKMAFKPGIIVKRLSEGETEFKQVDGEQTIQRGDRILIVMPDSAVPKASPSKARDLRLGLSIAFIAAALYVIDRHDALTVMASSLPGGEWIALGLGGLLAASLFGGEEVSPLLAQFIFHLHQPDKTNALAILSRILSEVGRFSTPFEVLGVQYFDLKSRPEGRYVILQDNGTHAIARVNRIRGPHDWDVTYIAAWRQDEEEAQLLNIPQEHQSIDPDHYLPAMIGTLPETLDGLFGSDRLGQLGSYGGDPEIVEDLVKLPLSVWRSGRPVDYGFTIYHHDEDTGTSFTTNHHGWTLRLANDEASPLEINFTYLGQWLSITQQGKPLFRERNWEDPYRHIWSDAGDPHKVWIGVSPEMYTLLKDRGYTLEGTSGDLAWKIVVFKSPIENLLPMQNPKSTLKKILSWNPRGHSSPRGPFDDPPGAARSRLQNLLAAAG